MVITVETISSEVVGAAEETGTSPVETGPLSTGAPLEGMPATEDSAGTLSTGAVTKGTSVMRGPSVGPVGATLGGRVCVITSPEEGPFSQVRVVTTQPGMVSREALVAVAGISVTTVGTVTRPVGHS